MRSTSQVKLELGTSLHQTHKITEHSRKIEVLIYAIKILKPVHDKCKSRGFFGRLKKTNINKVWVSTIDEKILNN